MKRLGLALIVLLILALACKTSQSVTPTSTIPTGATTTGSLSSQWEYSTSPFLPLSITSDALHRPYLYVAQQDGGLLVLDISNSKAPTKSAIVTKAQLAGLAATYVAQKDSDLYISLGNFFAAQGSKSGLAIVSVKDPHNPKVLSTWTSDAVAKGSSSVLVDGDYAYLAAMSEGVDIFDVSDPTHIRFIASIQPDINFPKANPSKSEHPNARGMALYKDLLYLAYDAGGLRVIDVSDTSHPKEITKYINPKMGGKTQAYNNIVINWPYAYAAIDYCGMEILNIQNAQNIQQVGWWNPWNCQSPSNIWLNSPGQTNQLVCDAQQKLVYLSAGDSELQVVNVSNPSQPQLAEYFGKPKDGLGAWGLSLSDNVVYLTYVNSLIPFKGDWSGIKAVSH